MGKSEPVYGIKLGSDGTVTCRICQMTCNGLRALSSHLVKGHKTTARSYYDQYVKRGVEGICANPGCGKPTRFRSISEGYIECCCKKCSGAVASIDGRAKARLAKAAATNMERYGVANVFQSDTVQDKIRKTNLERRGVEYPTQSEEVREKAAATFQERYGASTYLHSEAGSDTVRRTNIERYGVENGGGSAESRAKAVATFNAKYGASSPWQNDEFLAAQMNKDRERNGGMLYVQTDDFKRKSRDTQVERYGCLAVNTEEFRRKVAEANMNRYGTEKYFSSEDFRRKALATNMRKYGVDNYAKTHEYLGKVAATNLERYGSTSYMNSPVRLAEMMDRFNGMLSGSGCDTIGFTDKSHITYRCGVCGTESTESALFIRWRIAHGSTPCTACVPKNPETSMEEASLGEFVHSLGIEYDHYSNGFLGTFGADMVFEDRKVIVEYDGIYWHSELFRDKDYHLQKTLLAEDNGYHLVHIFSDEWMYRRDVVESRLRNLLCPDSLETVYARKCEVCEVPKPESDRFLDMNHIQGACVDSTRLGLYHDGRLVALMTFGCNRFDDGHELIRYCTLSCVRVTGGAGRLFKHYVDEHRDVDVITSYADRRWTPSTGAFYTKLGFTEDGASLPGYYYVNGDIRESRMKYQKHILVADGADASKSEHEIMLSRGMYRIYDCGNLRYRWTRA